jgi:hypothetical protein
MAFCPGGVTAFGMTFCVLPAEVEAGVEVDARQLLSFVQDLKTAGGVSYTSISVGDVIGTGGDFYEVSRTGFRKIPGQR